jgi:hypothetical protein
MNLLLPGLRTCITYFCIAVTKVPKKAALKKERKDLFWLMVSELSMCHGRAETRAVHVSHERERERERERK